MKVLLVDDHAILRAGLRAILEKMPSVEVVGEAADGREAVEMARTLRPQVVVMDISMPGLNGVDATRLIVSSIPDTKVIGLSMNSDRRYVLSMLEAGASGYLLKRSAADELTRALEAVASGMKYVSPAFAETVIESAVQRPSSAPAPRAELTPREREVLQLLAEGKTSKEIAAILDVAPSTVETHRRQISDKLELYSVAELTKYAVRAGLTSLGE